MTTPLDALLSEAVRESHRSAPPIARMATISATNSDGTVDVELADESVVANVRLLSRIYQPSVGHLVEILNTAGGWALLGRVETSNAPRIQTGTVAVPNSTGSQWSATTNVVFPVAFNGTPAVALSPIDQVPGSGSPNPVAWGTPNVSATGFSVRIWRGNVTTTTFSWLATDL